MCRRSDSHTAARASLYDRLPLEETRIDPLRAAIVGGVFGGVFGAGLVKLHLEMASAWWPDSGTSSFDIEDGREYLPQIDKVGHAFAG